MMKYIDLHNHTVHSDGRHTVDYVLKEAEKAGLSLMSISDHNSVGAYAELARHRHLFSGRILPAVELSTMYKGELIEILGYGIDVAALAEFVDGHYTSLHEKMVEEGKITARILHDKGVVLTPAFYEAMLNDPESLAGLYELGPRPMFLEDMRRHPENAHFFESEEEFYTMTRHRFARHYLFNPKSELYVDLSSMLPTLREICDVIHAGGGLAFLAHTYVYSPTIAASLDELTGAYDIDGLECHYGIFNKEQKATLSAYCDAHGLYKSGGSDFHGYSIRPDNIMGYADGERIEFDLIAPWFDKVKDRLI